MTSSKEFVVFTLEYANIVLTTGMKKYLNHKGLKNPGKSFGLKFISKSVSDPGKLCNRCLTEILP